MDARTDDPSVSPAAKILRLRTFGNFDSLAESTFVDTHFGANLAAVVGRNGVDRRRRAQLMFDRRADDVSTVRHLTSKVERLLLLLPRHALPKHGFASFPRGCRIFYAPRSPPTLSPHGCFACVMEARAIVPVDSLSPSVARGSRGSFVAPSFHPSRSVTPRSFLLVTFPDICVTLFAFVCVNSILCGFRRVRKNRVTWVGS